jgi:hypothetical protein
MEAPIPTPRLDDDEDVHWALSTASALWGRGERTEALKWLRRAAEQASDVNADVRALELFKAAAEVANRVSSAPPAAPTPTPPAPARKPGPPPAPPPRAGSVYPPPPIGSAPPPPPPPPAAQAAAPPQAPRPGSIPAPPPRPTAPSVPPAPQPPRAAPPARPTPAAAPVPARPPAVAVPSRAVAITAVNTPPAPQAMTPKRRRSFTGEARSSVERADRAERARSAEPARSGRSHVESAAKPAAAPPPARAEGTHKRRTRSFSDDEATSPRQPLRDEVEPASERTIATPITRAQVRAAVEQSSIFDDLDEDTRVLSAKHASHDEIDGALARLRAEPVSSGASVSSRSVPSAPLTEPMRAPVDGHGGQGARSFHEELTTDGTVGNGPTSAPTSPSTNRWQPRAEAGSQTERPPAGDAAPTPAPKRLETLPALRVAVLGTGVAGEVRLISLGNDEPPPGAAVAVLVPLTAADGEAVARLFDSRALE